MTELVGKGLSKAYGQRTIVSNFDASAKSGDCLGIIGPNGSGKSTVLKMLGGLLRPDNGQVTLHHNNTVVNDPLQHSGLVAPWLQVYEEFTVTELLDLQQRLHGSPVNEQVRTDTLERLGLQSRQNDAVRELSSGLRQRVLLALAVQRNPLVLLLDEPSITLDVQGKDLVESEIERHRLSGGVVILATNDPDEVRWCTSTVSLLT
ncbi:MAG: ABC transporter ATP-binding protein [Bradyrhizobiaceae bacterium]|nr:ABC transporter ATP-binding protein [Bradyrhizobiaceae bacterium]